jgi:hypothetical protein
MSGHAVAESAVFVPGSSLIRFPILIPIAAMAMPLLLCSIPAKQANATRKIFTHCASFYRRSGFRQKAAFHFAARYRTVATNHRQWPGTQA